MLEILIIIGLYNLLAKNAEKKGQSRAYGWLGVGLWIGGEILGFIIAISQSQSEMMDAYPYALLGAGLGAVISFIIVNALPVNEEGLAKQQRRFARPMLSGKRIPRFPKPRSIGQRHSKQPYKEHETIGDSAGPYEDPNVVSKKPRYPMPRSIGQRYLNQPIKEQETTDDSAEPYDEYNLVQCSNCQNEFGISKDSQTNHCPFCGHPLTNA